MDLMFEMKDSVSKQGQLRRKQRSEYVSLIIAPFWEDHLATLTFVPSGLAVGFESVQGLLVWEGFDPPAPGQQLVFGIKNHQNQ